MNFTDEALRMLARQMGENAVSSRVELETKLGRLLALILRTGQGHPSLLRWVNTTLPMVAPPSRLGNPIDPKWAAPRLARLLSSQLLRDARAPQDTVVNR